MNCAVCGDNKPLCESHIIPRFVFQHLKDTSGTGYMRAGENPNRRTQDGFKEPMLCQACEVRFQKYEKPFAEHFFKPIHSRGESHPTYGDWMKYFAVSVSWRNLHYHLAMDAMSQSVDKHNQRSYHEAL